MGLERGSRIEEEGRRKKNQYSAHIKSTVLSPDNLPFSQRQDQLSEVLLIMSDSITVPVIDLAQMEDPCGRKRGLDTVLHAVRDFGLFYVVNLAVSIKMR